MPIRLLVPSGRSAYVVEALTQSINNREFKPGERLPSVERLAEQLGVGRSSVREGIKQLQALGLLRVEQGRGTFVAQPKIQYGPSRLRSFSELVRELEMTPSSRIVFRATLAADAKIASALSLEIGASVHRLYRLRLADNHPFALEDSYLPADRLPGLFDDNEWGPQTSLYQILAERYNLIIQEAQQVIEVAMPVGAESDLLQVRPTSPLLQIATTAYLADGTAIECGRSLYRADRYKYIVRLSR